MRYSASSARQATRRPASRSCARYLDPSTGRFLSADTVRPNAPGTQGYNLYAYVANNPTTCTDPSGFSTIDPNLLAGYMANSEISGLAGVFLYLACVLDSECWGRLQELQGLVGQHSGGAGPGQGCPVDTICDQFDGWNPKSGLCGTFGDICDGVGDIVECATNGLDCVRDPLEEAAKEIADAVTTGTGWASDTIQEAADAFLGGLEKAAEALANAPSFYLNTLWPWIRAGVNAEITALALGAAHRAGGTCSRGKDLIWECTGLDLEWFDRLGFNSIVTFGNVILTKRAEISDVLRKHEVRHSDQWALAGLGTPNDPTIGQMAYGAIYLANVGLVGGNECANIFEMLADRGDGGYDC